MQHIKNKKGLLMALIYTILVPLTPKWGNYFFEYSNILFFIDHCPNDYYKW